VLVVVPAVPAIVVAPSLVVVSCLSKKRVLRLVLAAWRGVGWRSRRTRRRARREKGRPAVATAVAAWDCLLLIAAAASAGAARVQPTSVGSVGGCATVGCVCVGGLRGVRRFVLSLGLVFALEEGLCGNDKHVACREKEVARELFITHNKGIHK